MTRGARIYLDHNASSPMRPEARAAVVAALDIAGNPSSIHAEGRAARNLVETAREQVAALSGSAPRQVVFTSGGSEALNWVLRSGFDCIVASALEHDAVRAAIEHSGARTIEIAATDAGVIDLGSLARALDEAKGHDRAALALQIANNETGAIQPFAEAAALAKAAGVTVIADAVQAAGRIPLDFTSLGADYMALSAHKLGGPKGAGALLIAEGRYATPLVAGGGQEMGRRAGTENVPGIAGFGAAAEAARRDIERMTGLVRLRGRLERGVKAATPAVRFIADAVRRLPGTSSIALAGCSAETLVIQLDLAGLAVSAGSACTSGKVARSRVLTAMSLPEEIVRAAIRVSLGWSTRESDVEAFIAAWGVINARHGAKRVA
jgi:cysteine desulfurase